MIYFYLLVISLSTTESEYVAITHAAKEALWLRSLIGQVFAPFSDPIPLHNDNQSAISLTRDHQYHARTKHIDIRYHYIREVHDKGIVDVFYIDGNNNPADIFTKNLGAVKFLKFRSQLGLHFRESSAA